MWFKSNILSNGRLKTLHLLTVMVTVQKLQPTGIVLAGCCTYTQSNSFINLAKRFTVSSCIVSISNQCASSQFFWWTLQPCFVLKSRPQKKQKNFSSFPLSSRLFLITVSRFGLLAVGLCSSGQQQSLHFHDFYSRWVIKCHPKWIASNNSKPKWFQ